MRLSERGVMAPGFGVEAVAGVAANHCIFRVASVGTLAELE